MEVKRKPFLLYIIEGWRQVEIKKFQQSLSSEEWSVKEYKNSHWRDMLHKSWLYLTNKLVITYFTKYDFFNLNS